MSVLAAIILAVVFGPSALLLAYALAVYARHPHRRAATSTPSPTARSRTRSRHSAPTSASGRRAPRATAPPTTPSNSP